MAETKQQLIQRIQNFISNGFANDDFSMPAPEIELYINNAIAKVITNEARGNYQLESVYNVAEGLLSRYKFTTFTEDTDTKDWFITLPNPPISLPLGYSIVNVLATEIQEYPMELYPIHAKRVDYFRRMPRFKGQGHYYVVGDKMYITDIDFTTPTDIKIIVTMVGATDSNGVLNMSADMVQDVFTMVVNLIRQRYNLPQDINNDGNDIR